MATGSGCRVPLPLQGAGCGPSEPSPEEQRASSLPRSRGRCPQCPEQTQHRRWQKGRALAGWPALLVSASVEQTLGWGGPCANSGSPAQVPSSPASLSCSRSREGLFVSLILFLFFPETCAITTLHKHYPAWEFKKNPLWTVLGRSRPSSGEMEAQDRAAALACNQLRACLSSSILFYVKPSGQPEDLRGDFLGANLGTQLSDRLLLLLFCGFFFFFLNNLFLTGG